MHFLAWIHQANSYGLLQIICEYYRLPCPKRGITVRFQPLEHLHPLEYSRPEETVLRVGGSSIDLKSCTTSLELAEVSIKSLFCVCVCLYVHNSELNYPSSVIVLISVFYIHHQAHNALFVEEEASALSIWTIATICGALRLENVRFTCLILNIITVL